MSNPKYIFQKGEQFFANEKCTKPLKLAGQTAQEWADEMFEFEYCSECGKDKEDHFILPFNGNWFAKCKTEAVPDEEDAEENIHAK